MDTERLVSFLTDLPAATVHVVLVERCGLAHIRHLGPVASVDVSLDATTGQVTGVWLVAAQSSAVDPPEVLTVTCACGSRLLVDASDVWPEAHDHM